MVVVIIFGIFAPLIAGRLWLDYPIVQWLWSWLPLAMSAGMVADTFAGERERDTLEALLASRLPDRAIVLGKVAAVAVYGWAITLICWLAGWLSVRLAYDTAFAAAVPDLAFVLAWPVVLTRPFCLSRRLSRRADFAASCERPPGAAVDERSHAGYAADRGAACCGTAESGNGETRPPPCWQVSQPSWLLPTRFCWLHCFSGRSAANG